MFYTVYKTTHVASGKTYIGMHTTKLPNDSYLGSGTLINRAIKKYGRDAFVKEVLFVFLTPEEMISKEKELVSEGFVLRDDTYNLNVGGDGGWYHANLTVSDEQKMKRAKAGHAALEEKRASDPGLRYQMAEAGRRNLQGARDRGLCTDGAHWAGKAHSEETRSKISASHRERGNHRGEKNSQHGTLWVHSLTEARSKKIRPEDLSNHLQAGWLKGRKMRF